MPAGTSAFERQLTRRERWISLRESLAGALLVFGHNVWHMLPNEVPILAIVGLCSIRIRERGWRGLGFRRPDSWWNLILAAAAAGVLLQVRDFVTDPITHWLWNRPQEISSVFGGPPGIKTVLIQLGIVWTFAAFGEEFGYRRYLLNRAAEVGNRSTLAYAGALIWTSVLFGFGHYYKGPGGVFDSAVAGLILGGVYLSMGRNLWAPVLAHGIGDTIAVVAIHFGA